MLYTSEWAAQRWFVEFDSSKNVWMNWENNFLSTCLSSCNARYKDGSSFGSSLGLLPENRIEVC